MTTLELLKEFLSAYFVERKPDKGFAMVTDDIQCYGFADEEELCGIESLKKLAIADKYRKFTESELKIEKEKQISEESATLCYSLTRNAVTIRGRLIGNARQTPAGNRLYLINNTMLNPLQTVHVYEDVARANRGKLAKELLGGYVSGGLMGGYAEPGFPFYYINDSMLQYLGYANEAELLENTQGLLDNCIHEDDRKAVSKAVDEQSDDGQFQLEYRMMKKDGSYIWVKAIGKKIVAEDGRDAVLLACDDVTSEKEQDRFLQGIVGSLNAKLMLFAVDVEQKHTKLVYSSDTSEMRDALAQKSTIGIDTVYSGDRQRAWDAIRDAVENDAVPSVSFRTLDEDGKVKWVNASIAKHGEQDGLPVVLALFTASTIQNEVQLHALSQNGTGIAVIDADTHEVYFVNEAMFHMMGSEPFDYTNRICPDMLASCGGSCEKCGMHEVQEKEVLDKTVELNGKWMSLHAERHRWADKSVVSIYASDVTEKVRLQNQLEDLVQNMPSAICLYRWDGKKLHRLVAGYGYAELCGRAATKETDDPHEVGKVIVHPDDLADVQKFAEEFLRDGKDKMGSQQYRIWNEEKQAYIWITAHGKLVKQPDGTSLLYSMYTNETEQIELKNRLADTRTAINVAVKYGQVGLWTYDLATGEISQNLADTDPHRPADGQSFSPETLIERKAIHEEDADAYLNCYKKIRDGAENSECIVRALSRYNQGYHWIHVYLVRQPDATGKSPTAIGVCFDINQEIAEQNRLDKERRKMLAGDKKLVAYSIIDLRKEIVVEAKDISLGERLCDGDTCEEYDAKVAPHLLTEKERQRYLELRDPKQAIARYEAGVTKWSEDLRWKNRQGKIRWRRSVCSILENASAGTLYLYCYLYDVMEEKVMKDLFSGIQENLYLKSGVTVLSENQMCTFDGTGANRKLVIKDYDTAVEEYIRNEVLPEDADRLREQIRRPNIQKQLAVHPKDTAFVHRVMEKETLCYRQIMYAAVEDDSDVYVILIRDVSDLINESERSNAELQKALAEAKAGEQAKSEFLSRMSHEIRTPMNAIMGMTAIARDNKSDFLQVADCLAKIDSSSRYLLTLINDILEMSRIESGRTKLSEDEFDFDSLIDGISTVAEPLAKNSEIRLEISNNTKNGWYYGDHIRIQQIMINLIGNAIKFTKKSGRVRFAVSAVEQTETSTTFEFLVEDTGIGMSEEFMSKMFDPFSQEDSTTTSRYGGSGLGLAISKSLVEAMDGTITAESMVGVGTNFTVRIPLEKAKETLLPEPETSQAMPQEEQDEILKGKHVLMAEDHPMNRMITEKLLQRKEIRITAAENGKIAVEIFRNSEPNEYDAILMDIRMPVMDGLEATRQIRALDRTDAESIPIIAMTANALEQDRKNTKEVGMDEHLSKPIEPDKMYQVLAMQIARKTV